MLIKTILILFAAFSSTVVGIPRSYGELNSKIVGGTTVEWGEIPWQISIQDNSRDQYCGGSIISSEWVLTVAHCSFINAANYRIVSGTLEFKTNGTVHVITEIIRHAEYDSGNFENDIAVWKVDPPFEWDEQTAPVLLPEPGVATPDDANLTISGWGDKSYGGFPPLSKVLLKTEVPVVPKDECDRTYFIYGGIGPNMICGGIPEGGKAPCQGDSGGPVFLPSGELRGLVSWAYGCAWKGWPSVFTEVSAYRDWIKQNTGV